MSSYAPNNEPPGSQGRQRSKSPVLDEIAAHAVRAGLADDFSTSITYTQLPHGHSSASSSSFDSSARAYTQQSGAHTYPNQPAPRYIFPYPQPSPAYSPHPYASGAHAFPIGPASGHGLHPHSAQAVYGGAALPAEARFTQPVPASMRSDPFRTPSHGPVPLNPPPAQFQLDELEGGFGPVRHGRQQHKPATQTARERVQAIAGHPKKKAAQKNASAKRAAADAAARARPASGGVGPAGPDVAPTYAYKSVVDSTDAAKGQDASDVWWFVRPLEHSDRPASLSELPPAPVGSRSVSKPNAATHPFVVCRFCLAIDKWHTWKIEKGQTDTIRKHLATHHYEDWAAEVIAHQLKGWEKLVTGMPLKNLSTRAEREYYSRKEGDPFDVEVFHDLFVRWAVVTEQPLRVSECPELRNLLLYLCIELKDEQIPHRTALTAMIKLRFDTERRKIIDNMRKRALGRIHLTTDVWTDSTQLTSFVGLSAHYCVIGPDGHLTMINTLLAFREIEKSHTGANMADLIFEILKEDGILHKLGMITCDNASNNASMMTSLSDLLKAENIRFHPVGNRLRCFPHVVNLAVQAGCRALTEIHLTEKEAEELDELGFDLEDTYMNTALDDDPLYREILESDVIGALRRQVTALRASGQRRRALKQTIRDLNLQTGALRQIRVRNLLKDMDVRWSSTFLMIDRALDLAPAVTVMLNKPEHEDIAHHQLSEKQYEVLDHIRSYLRVPHKAQELLSAEKTPTLCLALPLYEQLIDVLQHLELQLPKIAHAIRSSRRYLEKYLAMARRTRAYSLAVILNPVTKFEWIEQKWSTVELADAREGLEAHMLEHATWLRQNPDAAPRDRTHATASHAAQAQSRGLAGFAALRSQICGVGESGAADHQAVASALPTLSEAELLAKDQAVVRAELAKYSRDPVIVGEALEDFDLLRWWQAHKNTYPILYRVALDVLPMQASSVPMERVFSSAKESTRIRRARLSPSMMEMLQVLKFGFRLDRLNFMSGFVATEQELVDAEFHDPNTKAIFQEASERGHGEDVLSYIED